MSWYLAEGVCRGSTRRYVEISNSLSQHLVDVVRVCVGRDVGVWSGFFIGVPDSDRSCGGMRSVRRKSGTGSGLFVGTPSWDLLCKGPPSRHHMYGRSGLFGGVFDEDSPVWGPIGLLTHAIKHRSHCRDTGGWDLSVWSVTGWVYTYVYGSCILCRVTRVGTVSCVGSVFVRVGFCDSLSVYGGRT